MKMKSVLLGLVLATGFIAGPIVADSDAIRDVDDNRAAFTGTWGPSTATILYYGDKYRYAWGAGGSNPTPSAEAVWTTATTTQASGPYEVYVRWTTHPNREETAYYRVYDGLADTTANCGCYKNQTQDGGAWQYCCTPYLTAGQYGVVKLGNEYTNSDEVVIADGVRIVRAAVDGGDIVNGSVTGADIASSTIYDYDMGDEAGVEIANASSRTGSTMALCSATNWTILATIPVTAPTSGYIIAATSGYHNADQAYHYMRVCLSDSSVGANCNSTAPIMEREGADVQYAYEMRWGLDEVYAVGAAGTKYIYLKGCKEYSTTTGRIGWNDFYGIFVPTRY